MKQIVSIEIHDSERFMPAAIIYNCTLSYSDNTVNTKNIKVFRVPVEKIPLSSHLLEKHRLKLENIFETPSNHIIDLNGKHHFNQTVDLDGVQILFYINE